MDNNGINNGFSNDMSNMNNQYGPGNAPAKQKAPNIFMQFAYSFVPPKYGCLAKVKTGSMIGFVTLFMLVITLISFVSLGLEYIVGGGVESALDELPDFELRDGYFSIDEDYLYDEDDMFVYLTGYDDEFTYEDVRELNELGYRKIILANRDKVSMLNNGEYQEYYFSQLGSGVEIDKDWIINSLMPVMWVCLAVIFVIFFVFRTLWYFLCAAIYLLIAMLIALVFQKKLSAGDLFRAAVYSRVPMFVVALLLSELPFVHFSIPGIIRILITIVIMGFGVWSLPQKN
ncbi:MAG: DUF1189 domain-containing protein [Acetatifactor sp.]|nr:DUF1189 domain-containing protein [Acetatifactor sp.]MDE7113434.1 DUF1189 domain-containing protein [Acetatifactor sp.]